MPCSTWQIGPRVAAVVAQEACAHSAGDRVSALIAEISIADAMVTANWRNSWPEMPGMKATGTNTESSTSVMAMIGPVIWRIASWSPRAAPSPVLLHHALDVLDHDDGVVDHDADRQHQREQRHGVGGEADSQQDGEGADQADRHGDDRDDRRAQAAQEQEDHDHHQDEGLDQRLHHLADRVGHEDRGVVEHARLEALGEARRAARPACALHRAGGRDRIGAGREIDADRRPPAGR